MRVIVLSGPFRAGKTFVCKALSELDIPTFDVDTYTVQSHTRSGKRFSGSGTDIATAVKCISEDIAKQEELGHTVIVFCGASIVYCKEAKCPVDLFGLVSAQPEMISEHVVFEKYYYDAAVSRLYQNVIAYRIHARTLEAKGTTEAEKERAKESLHASIGATTEDSQEVILDKFVKWYNTVMRNQLMGHELQENRQIHVEHGYTLVSLADQAAIRSFIDSVVHAAATEKEKPKKRKEKEKSKTRASARLHELEERKELASESS